MPASNSLNTEKSSVGGYLLRKVRRDRLRRGLTQIFPWEQGAFYSKFGSLTFQGRFFICNVRQDFHA